MSHNPTIDDPAFIYVLPEDLLHILVVAILPCKQQERLSAMVGRSRQQMLTPSDTDDFDRLLDRIDPPDQAFFDGVRVLSTEDRQRLREILSAEFGKTSMEEAPPSPTLREVQPEYLTLNQRRTPHVLPGSRSFVWISFQTPSRLADDLQAVTQEQHTSIDGILNGFLSTSLALLQIDNLSNEDVDNLAVRRELAATSVAALGDIWDNELDHKWQEFRPCPGKIS